MGDKAFQGYFFLCEMYELGACESRQLTWRSAVLLGVIFGTLVPFLT